MKNVKLGDIVVIAIVLIVAAALFVFGFFMRSDKSVLLVSYGDNEDHYDLSVDNVFTVENNGHTLVIEIKEGKAYVVSSTCDGQDCVNMGKIPSAHTTIACLPARVFLKIISDNVGEGYDGVVG